MSDAAVSIRFGAEELLLLMKVSGIGSLPGMDAETIKILGKQRLQQALIAGLNSLWARGLLTIERGDEAARIIVDTTVLALLSTCGLAQRVLHISRLPADGLPEESYVHFGEYLTAIHTLVAPGIHEMVGTVDRALVLEFVLDALHIGNQPSLSAPPIVLDEPVFNHFLELVRSKRKDEAIALLESKQVESASASLLAESFAGLIANSMVALLTLPVDDNAPSMQGFALVECLCGLWHINVQATATGGTIIHLKPISGAECRQRIEAMVPDRATSVE